MKILLSILLISSLSFAQDKKAKPETKDRLAAALKEVDPEINTEGYPVSPKDEALLKMIEELEERVAALEKKQ